MSEPVEVLKAMCSLVSGYEPSNSLLEQTSSEEFWKLLDWHQLAPLLAVNELPEENGVRVEVKEFKLHIGAQSLQLSHEMVELVDALTSDGVRVLSLKGAPLAMQLYGSVTKRYCRDIDLFVSLEDAKTAIEKLVQCGYQCDEQRLFEDTYFRHYCYLKKDVSFYHPEKQIVVELHWRLFDNPEMLPVTFEDIWQGREHVMLNEYPVPVPGFIDNTVYLAVHGTVAHWFRLKWVADWHQLLSRQDMNWPRIVDRADELGVALCLRNALDNSDHWFGPSGVSVPFVSELGSSRKLLQVNLKTQRECQLPSTGRQALDRLLILRTLKGVWQEYCRVLGTSVRDLDVIRLPASLFFLNYLLRPFVYVGRRMGVFG